MDSYLGAQYLNSKKKMNIKEKTFKDLIVASITELIGFISNFLILYLLSRIYPPNEFVLYPFSNAFLLFFLIFANFGIGTTIIRYLSASRDEGMEKIKKVISEGFRWELLFTMIASLILFSISTLFEEVYRMPNLAIFLRYTSLYLFFTNLIYYFESIFQGLWKFKIYAISNVIFNFLKLFIVFLNFEGKNPIYTIMALFSAVALIQFTLMFIFIQIKYNIFKYILQFDKDFTKTLLKFSILVFLPILFQFLILNLNQFTLAYFVSPAELANYYITFMFIQILSIPIFILIRLTLPYASHYTQINGIEKKNFDLIYNSIFKYGLLIMIPITFYIFYFSNNIIALLFGNEYYPVADYLKVYIFYLNLRIIIVAGETFLIATNEPKLVFKLNIFTASASLILSLLLIPLYQIYGAILSIIIPHSTYIIYSAYIVKKKNKIKFESKIKLSVLKYTLSSIIPLVMIMLLKIIINIDLNNIIILTLCSGIYFILYFILVVAFKAIKIDEFIEYFRFLLSPLKLYK